MVTKREPDQKRPKRRDPAKQENAFAGTFWESLAEIGNQIPDEALAKLPADGASNLKHYLCGHPKNN